MPLKDLDEVIGAPEVCKICKFSNQYLHYLVFAGKIRAKKVSGVLIFLRSDILKFQKERKDKAKIDKRIKLKK